MSIDLTKPIKVRYIQPCPAWEKDSEPVYLANGAFLISKKVEQDETEVFRNLFEEAPRTKLEHGKMLAWIKKFTDPNAVFMGSTFDGMTIVCEEARALIDEIEGAVEQATEQGTREPKGAKTVS